MPAFDAESAGRPVHRWIDLPHIGDERGWLLVAQAGEHVPFEIRRLFVLHSIAEGATRGHHAHRRQHQLLIMLAGCCEVVVDNGEVRQRATLSEAGRALHVPPGLWLELGEFSPEAVCAVLASGRYDESDYVRDRVEFDRLASAQEPTP